MRRPLQPGQTPGTKPPVREGSDVRIPKHLQGNKHKQGKGGKKPGPGGRGGGGLGMYGAMGGFPGVSVREAQRRIAAEIREGVQDLRHQRRVVRHEASEDRQKTKADYQRGLGDLEHIYGETGDFIAHQGNLINNQYEATQDRATTAQNALLNVLSQGSSEVAGGANAELARLGIEGSGDMGEFAADAANNTAIAQQTGANNMANLEAMQAGAGSISALLSGMNAGQHQSNVGQQLNARNDRFAEIQQNKIDNFNEVREAIKELKGQRGDLVRQLLEQMTNTRWGQYMDMAQLKLQRGTAASQNRYYNALTRSMGRSGSSGSGGYSSGDYVSDSEGSGSGGKSDSANNIFNQLALDELTGGKKGK